MKVKFCNKNLWDQYYKFLTGLGLITSMVFIFVTIPKELKLCIGGIVALIALIIYLYLWHRANTLKRINIGIDSTNIEIKEGDLFEQKGLIAIGFNEYFDTLVDDKIISKASLNGIFINKYLNIPIERLDNFIKENTKDYQVLGTIERKAGGKTLKFKLGSIHLFKDKYILTALSKFNDKNEARLSMPEYLEFLVNFWDNVNSIYSQRSVSVPIFGGGITRFKGHKTISDEDLLKIMLWTFKISEMRFKHPAKLTIVIHSSNIDKINLNDIKGLGNGL